MQASIFPILAHERYTVSTLTVMAHGLRRIRAMLCRCIRGSVRNGCHGCYGRLVADSGMVEARVQICKVHRLDDPCGCAFVCPDCGREKKSDWETYLTKVNSSVTPCTPSNLMISRPKSGFVVRCVFVFFLYSPFWLLPSPGMRSLLRSSCFSTCNSTLT